MPYDGQYDPRPQYQDIPLKCSCGTDFIWTKGEQNFLQKLCDEGKIAEVKQPMRCPECRAKKKARMSQGVN